MSAGTMAIGVVVAVGANAAIEVSDLPGCLFLRADHGHFQMRRTTIAALSDGDTKSHCLCRFAGSF